MRLKIVLGKAAAVAWEVGIVLVLMELLLWLGPNLVPSEVRVNPPVRGCGRFETKPTK